MGTLSEAKTLGGVGAILTLLGIVPYAGAVLVIVGWIMVLIAIKYISDNVQDRSIYNNALIATAVAIIGAAVGGIIIGVNIFHYLGTTGGIPNSVNSTTFQSSSFMGLVTGAIAGLAIFWILAIVASYFLWTSFKSVTAKVNVSMFRTGALIYFIGSILTIILVGFILTFVGQILFVVAFFSLPESLPITVANQPPPPSTGPSPSPVSPQQ
jgi:uncharacterized membrane protein